MKTKEMKCKLKNLRNRIRIDKTPDGVCVWLDDLWVIDASTILDDGTFSIATNVEKYKDPTDKRNKHYVIRKGEE